MVGNGTLQKNRTIFEIVLQVYSVYSTKPIGRKEDPEDLTENIFLRDAADHGASGVQNAAPALAQHEIMSLRNQAGEDCGILCPVYAARAGFPDYDPIHRYVA